MIIRKTILLFLSSLLFISCNPETNDHNPDVIDGALIPSAIGNYWIYIDSLYIDGEFNSVSFDTMTIVDTMHTLGKKWWKVEGYRTLPYIWEYYAIENDSVYSIQGGWSPILSLDYIYPTDSLTVLQTLIEGDLGLLRYVIKSTAPVTTDIGTFQNCGKYYGGWSKDSQYAEEYIKPGIGFVKSIFWYKNPNQPRYRHSRYLFDYHFN